MVSDWCRISVGLCSVRCVLACARAVEAKRKAEEAHQHEDATASAERRAQKEQATRAAEAEARCERALADCCAAGGAAAELQEALTRVYLEPERYSGEWHC